MNLLGMLEIREWHAVPPAQSALNFRPLYQ